MKWLYRRGYVVVTTSTTIKEEGKRLDRIYHVVALLCVVCALTVIAFFIYLSWPLHGFFTVEIAVISAVVTACFCGLVIVGSYHVAGWLSAWADTKFNHSRLIKHQNHSFWLQDDGSIYHTGAMQESAKISTYALQMDSAQQMLQEAKGHTPNDQAEDAMSQKVVNLASQGKGERVIARTLGVTRSQVRKLKEGMR